MGCSLHWIQELACSAGIFIGHERRISLLHFILPVTASIFDKEVGQRLDYDQSKAAPCLPPAFARGYFVAAFLKDLNKIGTTRRLTKDWI